MAITAWIVWTDKHRRVNFTIGDLHSRFDCAADAVKIGNALVGRVRDWIDVSGVRMTFQSPKDAERFGSALVRGSGKR